MIDVKRTIASLLIIFVLFFARWTFANAQTIIAISGEDEPEPLVITRTLSDAELSNKKPLDSKQIIFLTNQERQKIGLNQLSQNEKLTKIAEYKVKDMITKKYFAHKSPDGLNIDDLAVSYNYNFSLVGENLAMGDFINSLDVVNGWMASPGHRANILKKTYVEIGVYATTTYDKGKIVWYAVQEFGRPAPICKKPDQNTESFIKMINEKIKIIDSLLKLLKEEINNNSNTSKGLIDSYNKFVDLSNIIYAKTSIIVSNYNETVKSFNDCATKENEIIKQ